MKEVNIRKIDYIYMLLLIACTSFEFFFREDSLFILLGIVAFIHMMSDNRKFLNNDIIMIFVAMITIFILQYILIDYYYITSVISRTTMLVFSFAIATRIWSTFTRTFTDIIYAICILSLVIYFSSLLIPSLRDILIYKVAPLFTSLNSGNAIMENGGRNILIYNFQIENFAADMSLSNIRNCGPFWEPGMFSFFISIALYLNLIIYNNTKKKYTIIFILALITTFSAGGYVSGAFVIFIYVLKQNRFLPKIFGALLLVSAISYMLTLDIIGQKISDQISNAEIGNDLSRFSAMMTQARMIEASPIIGGESIEKYAETKTLASGLLLTFVVYGIPFGLFYYYYIHKSCVNLFKRYNLKGKYGSLFFILLIIISVSQTIFNMALLSVIMFIGLITSKVLIKSTKHTSYAKF